MTPKQNALYWREWGAVVRQCKASNLPVPERHDLHLEALGAHKSHLAFSNEDFDQVLAQFRTYSRPADLGAQLRQTRQPRIRLAYAVNALASAAYWAAIARDRFGTDDLEALSLEQLTQLRNTLKARRDARRKAGSPAGGGSISDTCSLRGAGADRVLAGTIPADS
jgi:hypothetical protein